MRFLIVPWASNFRDCNMLRGLAGALRSAGHDAIWLSRPLVECATVVVCRDLRIDVLFNINRARPPDLPANIRHIAWYQDPLIPSDIAERVRDSDIVYGISATPNQKPEVKDRCRSGYLFLAVDEASLDAFVPPASKSVDFSFCGYISPGLPPFKRKSSWEERIWQLTNRVGRLPFVGTALCNVVSRLFRSRMPCYGLPLETFTAMSNVVDAYYPPLRGELDVEFLIEKMREIAVLQLGPLSKAMNAVLEANIDSMALALARLVDRAEVVENISRVTDCVELFGENWNMHPQFAPYHKGILTGLNALFCVYARSRLNGTNTLGGFGLHVRNLECMAVGGFLFSHASRTDNEPGGLQTCFEPGVHYGEYTSDNIQEEAMRWIRDDRRRDQAGACAAAVVREKHLWRHRADQILGDLGDGPVRILQ